MKKLNNKGLTVIELVVTFAILMVLIIGMLDVILGLKNQTSEKMYARDFVEFRNNFTYVVESDLIKNHAVKIKLIETIDKEAQGVNEKGYKYVITFKDDTEKDLIIDITNMLIVYDNKKYNIPNKNFIEFRDKLVYRNEEDTLEDKLKNNINICVDKNNFIKINIPFFEVDEPENLGIDIVYPIGI